MGYNVKNYRKQGGDEWVIGGKLTFEDGAEVDGLAYLDAAIIVADLDSDADDAVLAASQGKILDQKIAPLTASFDIAAALVGALVAGYGVAAHGDASESPIEVLAANEAPGGARAVLIIVKCAEDFAGGDTLPIFAIGDGNDADAFGAVGEGTGFELSDGDIVTFAGELAEGDPIEITVTDATGETPGGEIAVFVIALPAKTSAGTE